MGRKTKKRSGQETGSPVRGASGSGAPMAGWFSSQLTRRSMGKGLAWTALLGAAGVTIYKVAGDNDNEISTDSLELQRREGWDVGSTQKALVFNEGLTAIDSVQKSWSAYDPNYLLSIYRPRNAAWQPFFVPTLIQSLGQSSLNRQMRPINTALMRDCHDRAGGLRDLLAQAPDPSQTMIVSDLPGPGSVAVGAALSDVAEVVPLFDNWPHPLGVVRSHETLGAMLYYAHEIEEKRSKLSDKAPALMLLDSDRLNPFTNEDNQFDNRYLAKLPTSDQLKQRGVTQVIYLVKDKLQTQELDDLNDEFLEWQKNGIGVRMLQLSEFRAEEVPQVASQAGGSTPAGTGIASAPTGGTTVIHRNYYYGGSPYTHWWFYDHYYYRSPRTLVSYREGRSIPIPKPAMRPTFSAPSYRPASRPTIFSASRIGGTSGIGKTRPSGFGRTTVRVASNGLITGTRPGRSGSYGRSGGGWFSG